MITGDITKPTCQNIKKSGLRHAIEVLKPEEISFNFSSPKTSVRHPVVARIVEAYEAFDLKEQTLKAKKESQYQKQQEAAAHES